MAFWAAMAGSAASSPGFAGSLMGGVTAPFEMGFGALRFSRGQRELKRLIRNMPKYDIQSEYEANVNMAKSMYQGGMPGIDIAKDMIYGSTSAGLSRAEETSNSSMDLLGATTDIYARELQSLNALALQNAQSKMASLDRLMHANATLAAEKSKQWEYNKWIPHQIRMGIAQSKMQSGESYLQQGSAHAAGSAAAMATEMSKISELSKIYNQGSTQQQYSSGGGTMIDSNIQQGGGYNYEYQNMNSNLA